MANPRPGPGKKFQKGNNANPKGAGAHNPIIRNLKKISQDELADIGQLVIQGDISRLEEIRNDKSETVLRVWMASVALKAIERGDSSSMDVLLNRIVGKPKDSLHITTDVEKMTDEQLIQRAKEISLILKDKE